MIYNTSEGILIAVYFITLYLTTFWLLVLFDKELKIKKKLTDFPLFSIIIPAWNEEETITETLTSLKNLDYPKDKLEIIVVNDGSEDNTQILTEDFIKKNPSFNIKLINQPKNLGKGRALNTGLKYIKGEFFACLDADSFVTPDSIKLILPYFDSLDIGAVCPLMKVKEPKTLLQKVQWYEYIINMFYKHLNAKLDCVHVTPGPFSTYKTNIIKKIGGYDESTITEDLELALRLQKNQYKIVQAMDAQVYTTAPKDLKGVFNQRLRWYRGSCYNTYKYKKLMFNKKYGDFGFIRMPTIVLSGMIAIVMLILISYDTIRLLKKWLLYLISINFNVTPFLINPTINLTILNLNYLKIFMGLTLLGIGLFVMIYSHKVTNEKITRYDRTFVSLFTYMFLYSIIITFVWAKIFIDIILKKEQKW